MSRFIKFVIRKIAKIIFFNNYNANVPQDKIVAYTQFFFSNQFWEIYDFVYVIRQYVMKYVMKYM